MRLVIHLGCSVAAAVLQALVAQQQHTQQTTLNTHKMRATSLHTRTHTPRSAQHLRAAKRRGNCGLTNDINGVIVKKQPGMLALDEADIVACVY